MKWFAKINGKYQETDWDANIDQPESCYTPVIDESGETVALVVSTEIKSKAIEVNARLISAAPELLAALQRLMGTHNLGNASTHEAGCRCVTHEALAAIAKATEAA